MTYYVELSDEYVFLTMGKCYPITPDGGIVDNDRDRLSVSPMIDTDRTALIIEWKK